MIDEISNLTGISGASKLTARKHLADKQARNNIETTSKMNKPLTRSRFHDFEQRKSQLRISDGNTIMGLAGSNFPR